MNIKRVPILRGDGVRLSAASEALGVPNETLRRWCIRYGIGDQWEAGSVWRVSLPALRMVIDQNWGALELLRQGCRSENKHVRPYLPSEEHLRRNGE